jgi:hypothetical protein
MLTEPPPEFHGTSSRCSFFSVYLVILVVAFGEIFEIFWPRRLIRGLPPVHYGSRP